MIASIAAVAPRDEKQGEGEPPTPAEGPAPDEPAAGDAVKRFEDACRRYGRLSGRRRR